MTLFLTASSFYSIFTQVPKTFNSTVALQVGFLKHLGDFDSSIHWGEEGESSYQKIWSDIYLF